LRAPLLVRHGDLEAILGSDQVIVVVLAEVDLHSLDRDRGGWTKGPGPCGLS
jgi:hypothetical protein